MKTIEYTFAEKQLLNVITVQDKEGNNFNMRFLVTTDKECINLENVFSYYYDKFSDFLIKNLKRFYPNIWTITVSIYENCTMVWIETNAQFIYFKDFEKMVEMIGCDYEYMTQGIDTEWKTSTTIFKFVKDGPIDFNRFQDNNQTSEELETMVVE